jgi:exopolysaccharide biosynthesis polyprenyl glycosylphosphotransferase
MPKCSQLVRKEIMTQIISKGKLHNRSGAKFKIYAWEFVILASELFKRFIDISFALIFIVLCLPIYVITAICIYIESPGPVTFKQARVGKNGRHFVFYKFRSMVLNAERLKDQLISDNESDDGVIFKMKKDPRITTTGRFIRKFSIDELPQLFNVLFGDMSLVGPRPPVPREVAEYSLEDRKRLHVKPGITCIWQVSGRSDIPFKQQVELDKEYIKSRSFIKDFTILLKTIPAVLTGKGAY